MNSLQNLKKLLIALKAEERSCLINFLSMNVENQSERFSRSTLLANAIWDNQELTANELQKLLYGKENYGAFNKLVNRLQERIADVMLLDQNLERDTYTARNKAIFKMRKKLLQADLLFLRGITDELESMYNSVINEAKEFEVYDTCVYALLSKKRYISVRAKKSKMVLIDGEIQYFNKVQQEVSQAQLEYQQILNKMNFAFNSTEYEAELYNAISYLGGVVNFTSSKLVEYSYLFLLNEKHQIKNELQESKDVLEKQLNLVHASKSVYTPGRIGSVLINLSNINILLGNYSEAIINAKESARYFGNSVFNYSLSREYEALGEYHNGSIDKARMIFYELWSSKSAAGLDLMRSRWSYYLACISFQQGTYQDSISFLQEMKELEKDKEGFNLYRRLLLLMNRISLGETDAVELQLQNMERQVKRVQKMKHVRPRILVLTRLFLKLINENYNFTRMIDSRKSAFSQLLSNDPDYKWYIKSPELFPLHDWMLKMAGKGPAL